MSAGFAPPPGDAEVLRSAAARLGESAAGLADQRQDLTRASGLALLALLRSDSAPRIDELRNGLRGMAAEVERVRSAGEQVADIVRERSGRLRRLHDDLEHDAALSRRAEQHAEARGADGSSPDATAAHRDARVLRESLEDMAARSRAAYLHGEAQAAAEVNRLTDELAAGPPGQFALVQAGIRDGSLTPASAWTQVTQAYETLASADHLRNQGTLSYQVLGGIAGFYEAGADSLQDAREALVHPVDMATGLARTARHPVSAARAAWHEGVDPLERDWANGDRGHNLGAATEEILEVVVGAKGVAKGIEGGTAGSAWSARTEMPIPLTHVKARSHAADLSHRIASGHAFDKHVLKRGEFARVRTRGDFSKLIQWVIENGEVRYVGRGRLAYWSDGTMVIKDPHHPDGGTAFVPRAGREYFQRMR